MYQIIEINLRDNEKISEFIVNTFICINNQVKENKYDYFYHLKVNKLLKLNRYNNALNFEYQDKYYQKNSVTLVSSQHQMAK